MNNNFSNKDTVVPQKNIPAPIAKNCSKCPDALRCEYSNYINYIINLK